MSRSRIFMLKMSNMDQNNNSIDLSADLSSFTFLTPSWMVNRECRVTLISSMISSQDSGTQTSCLNANVFASQIRVSINTNSFSTENNASDSIIGSAFFPTGSKNAYVNNGHETELGICHLQSEILVERLQYDDDGFLVPAFAFNVDYKLCPMYLEFLVEFLD